MSQLEPASPAGPLRIDPAEIDPDAARVLRRLTGAGFDAYLVGGCVRDLLLHRRPKDFDIATGARPRQIKRLFRNSRIIGRRFRLVHVHFGERILEVSTFRAPPPRQDDDLYVTRDNVFGTEEQDALRRDFTINGLFYDVGRERVIDHVGGIEDLEARRIRMIGDPDERLREDPVRILRAAKFAGRLDFRLTTRLQDAVRTHCRDLEKAAPPRVLEELYRLLTGEGSARSFRLLEELGALRVVLPEICPLPPYIYRALERLEQRTGGRRTGAPHELLLAVLLSPVVKDPLLESGPADYEALVDGLVRPIAQRLTASRRDTTGARQCLAGQPRLLGPPEGRTARRFASRESFPLTLALRDLIGPLREVDPDPLDGWRALAREEGPPEHGPRRRRRRRGGRRRLRGRRKAGKDGAWKAPGSSSAPAPPPTPDGSPKDS